MARRGWQRASSEEETISAKVVAPIATGSTGGEEEEEEEEEKELCTRQCQCWCTVGTLAVLFVSALVTSALLSQLGPSEDPAATMDRLTGVGPPELMPPVPPALPPLPPLPPESPPARCLDQNPKAEFCSARVSRGLCNQRHIALQCALSCGACEAAAPERPPPQRPPLHPPSHPPRPPPPLLPSPSPPLQSPAPLPPPPSAPEQSALCARLVGLQEITGYCFESSERQASRAKCESTYVRLVASTRELPSPDRFLPCYYDEAKGKCNGRFPAEECPGLAPPPAPRAPPLPPTQPPPPPESVADRLNARFVGAVLGSGKLSEIGVIMHAFDATEDPQAPWAPCPQGNVICGFLHDKVSASAVYLGKTNAYTVKYGGVVLHPSIARVKCGYVGDGGTREKTCSPNAASRCVSGCGIFASDSGHPKHDSETGQRHFISVYCDAAAESENGWCGGYPWRTRVRGAPPNPNPGTEPSHVLLMKAWPPLSQDLGKMFTLDRSAKEYNELIVDGDHWTRHLPGIIEAFVITPERDGDVVELQKTRERFLRTYGLNETAAPVVRFDGARGRAPFVLA